MRIIGFFTALLLSMAATAQPAKPQWTFTGSPAAGGAISLKVTAAIPQGIIIYSSSNAEGLPALTIELDSSSRSKAGVTATRPGNELTRKDPQLDNAEVKYFEGSLTIDYTLQLTEPLERVKGKISWMGFDGAEFIGPEETEFLLTRKADGSYSAGSFQLAAATGKELLIPGLDLKKPADNCGIEAQHGGAGLLKVFIWGLLGGLLAMLTPCVFPLIPLTVSFFTKKSGSKSKGTANAVLYGLFIFFIYAALSIPFHVANLPDDFYNQVATNMWLNLFFFIVFVVFAISFFGYFEITLPSGLANSTDAKRGTNIIGIFFMALTLAIVSFSCTGPILGTLLASNAAGGKWALTAGLAGFGVALGLPFALFAMFPHWLAKLPRSGGWMDVLKVVLGFVELALALKFLSNADLVAHLGILKREVFFGLWIAIGLASFAFLMGWFSFKKQYSKPVIGRGRRIAALAFLAFSLYLVPGVTNTRYANISLVSGFPPPACYSIYSHPVNCIEPLHDYAEAVKLAKEKNMPILIDFTGYACVNCRKMEENVWPRSIVKQQMDKYILVSLYVDDKKQLPPDQQFVYTTKDSTERKIITIGDKWATFESENFEAVSQPLYVLLSPGEKLLAPPVSYKPNAKEYAAWLECGYRAFEKEKKQ